jgi:diguanylate cyclase (GGDEF)-like protein
MTSSAENLNNEATVVDCFEKYAHFSKVMLDAFAVVDITGKIKKANPMLGQITGIKSRQLIKLNSFDDSLSLSINGEKLSVGQILDHDTPTRFDEVTGEIENSDQSLNLIIGYYPFFNEDNTKKLGGFILIRDVTAETNLQGQYKEKAEQSITDPLTGLFTRGYFEEYLSGQVDRMLATKESERYQISLIMCDIDFFKKINDGYSHQHGDHIIKTVSSIMKNTYRKTDVCCRYGGEEFLVILPACDLKDASISAEKFRTAIESAYMEFNGDHIPVTLSCGVATLDLENESYEEALARADQALYHSKHNGRNLVSVNEDGDNTAVIKTK